MTNIKMDLKELQRRNREAYERGLADGMKIKLLKELQERLFNHITKKKK